MPFAKIRAKRRYVGGRLISNSYTNLKRHFYKEVLDIIHASLNQHVFLYKPKKPLKEVGVIESMPKTKPRLTISPGHGGTDPGAVGPTGLREKDVVLDIVLRMRPILESYVELKYTRTSDVLIPLYDRPKVANNFGSDMLLECHVNGSTNTNAHGMETFHSKNGEWGPIFHNKAQQLAKLTHDRVVAATGFSDRGLKTLLVTRQDSPIYGLDYYAAIRRANCPTILPEWGFITNPGDEAKLKDPAIRQIIAEETAYGIFEFLGMKKTLTKVVEADVAPFIISKRTVIEARVLIERVLGGCIYALGKDGFSSRVGQFDFHVFFGQQNIIVENTSTKQKLTITSDIAPFTVQIDGGGRTMIEVRAIVERVLGGRITKVDQQNGFFAFEVIGKHVTMYWNERQIYVKEMN